MERSQALVHSFFCLPEVHVVRHGDQVADSSSEAGSRDASATEGGSQQISNGRQSRHGQRLVGARLTRSGCSSRSPILESGSRESTYGGMTSRSPTTLDTMTIPLQTRGIGPLAGQGVKVLVTIAARNSRYNDTSRCPSSSATAMQATFPRT